MKKRVLFTAALVALAAFTAPLHAQTPTPATAESRVLSDGVVRKIDTVNNKITLKHGPLVNLDMPGMTMMFRVVSPTLLNNVKEGDAVKFYVERRDGALTITEIQPAK